MKYFGTVNPREAVRAAMKREVHDTSEKMSIGAITSLTASKAMHQKGGWTIRIECNETEER